MKHKQGTASDARESAPGSDDIFTRNACMFPPATEYALALAAVTEKPKNEWDIEAAISTYNVDGWGTGYFTVNAAGNAEVRPLQEGGGSIDILEVVNEARERGLGFPLVIRFQDLLRHRVEAVNRAFQSAMTEFGYRNNYRGVFPIKVNQLREVIEEIVDAGQEFHFGLEAGSKPELIAALAMHKDLESLIVCNGYKDRAYIRSAMMGRRLGKSVIIVVEKIEELEQTIRIAKEMGVEPHIGIRVRLHSKGSGKWTTSGGEDAKFGLDTANLVCASELLKAEGFAHCLKLVHFHVGSQVPDISTIKRAVREAARYYAKLSKLGHELGYLDVGGGLGRGLRRLAHQLRQLDQLFAPGIRQRRRLEHHGRVRLGESRASGDRQRRRARDRGASFRPGRGSVWLDREERADGEG